ncbi:MAG: hypothetical protein K9H25_06100 [Rhodospirillum sp.]|nr:hypothetical protein [Rhodospirillum sp.]MCF8491419.1 hypothetical protein [Rhodospirillum sp.]MCF8501308.1 hypothetical protein [Rhodospirillum sp.]
MSLFLSPFMPFLSPSDGEDGSATPFSAFEAWTGAVMAPWMAWVRGSPWIIPPTLASAGSSPLGGPLAFTPLGVPMGIIAALSPALKQAYATANRTAEALAEALAETNDEPVLVDITDTSGPFSIRVAISLKGSTGKGRGASLSEGPVIDHESALGTLPSN